MRRKTTAVRIGNVVLSSEEPVLVQSMLNTSTREVDACVEQAIRIIEAGGRLVRITAPGVKEAEMLGNYTVVCVNGDIRLRFLRIFILLLRLLRLPPVMWKR